jgi:hypothetical protein
LELTPGEAGTFREFWVAGAGNELEARLTAAADERQEQLGDARR